MRRHARALVMPASAALALTAAGGSLALVGSGPAGAQPVAPRSVQFTWSAGAVVSGSKSDQPSMSITGTGRANFADHALEISANLPAALDKALPGGDAAGVLRVFYVGSTLYFRYPGLQNVAGKPYLGVTIPSKVASKIPGAFTDTAKVLGDVDEIVSFGQSHGAKVTSLGTATIDGVAATGHQLVWHLGALAKALGTSESAVNAASSVVPTGKARLAVRTWAGKRDRMVRGSVAVTRAPALPPPSSRTTGEPNQPAVVGVAARADFSKYGSPVAIPVPISTQVTTITLKQFLRYVTQGSGATSTGAAARAATSDRLRALRGLGVLMKLVQAVAKG